MGENFDKFDKRAAICQSFSFQPFPVNAFPMWKVFSCQTFVLYRTYRTLSYFVDWSQIIIATSVATCVNEHILKLI